MALPRDADACALGGVSEGKVSVVIAKGCQTQDLGQGKDAVS